MILSLIKNPFYNSTYQWISRTVFEISDLFNKILQKENEFGLNKYIFIQEKIVLKLKNKNFQSLNEILPS